jgi:8-oxo-dGTP pyrophosphatase MutT (NUDIX family)
VTHNTNLLVESGRWNWGVEGVDWELYASSTIPKPKDCTAAFCVAMHEGKIILAREDRGWGLIGGHIDDDETVERALERECLEEAGFIVSEPVLFGYRKIIATTPVTHPEPNKAYPFPISYIAYYYSVSKQPLGESTEPEVLEVGSFTLTEIDAMQISDFSTIALGLDFYRKDQS